MNSNPVRVGILTFHHTVNYGATLQAYALLKTIKSQGYKAELIDYRPYQNVKYHLKELFPINDWRINRHWPGTLIKAWKMRRFLRKRMPLSQSKCYSKHKLNHRFQQYDIVVCGSDEIWTLKSVLGFDPAFFLDFVNQKKTRKVSYAASFGRTKDLAEHREKVRELLSQFHAVSVRDTNSLKLVKEECEQPAVRVVDPTFLTRFAEEVTKPNLEEKYLLIYNEYKLTKTQENVIRSIAKSRGLRIISVGYYNRIAQKNFVGSSPEEWLGYFANATYVVTNFFHGTVFSIIFRKPFTVFSNPYKATKILDLLNRYGLEDRIFLTQSNSEFSMLQTSDINYSQVYQKLEREIQLSQNYLLEALSQQPQAAQLLN